MAASAKGDPRQRTLGRQGRTRGVRTQRTTADPGRARNSRMSRRRPETPRRRWQRLEQESRQATHLDGGRAAVSDSISGMGGLRRRSRWRSWRGSRGRLQSVIRGRPPWGCSSAAALPSAFAGHPYEHPSIHCLHRNDIEESYIQIQYSYRAIDKVS